MLPAFLTTAPFISLLYRKHTQKRKVSAEESNNISQEMSSNEVSEPGIANDLELFEELGLLHNGSVSTANDSFGLCADRDLSVAGNVSLPDNVLMAIQSIQFIYYFVIFLSGLSFNLVIIWLPYKHRKLRTVEMAVGVHIALINLMRIAVDILLSLVSAAAGIWVFGGLSCAIQGFLVTLNFSARRAVMLKFAVDRCLLVFSAFHYPKWRTRVVVFMSVMVWIVPVVFLAAGIPVFLDCYSYEPLRTTCFFSGTCSTNCFKLGILIFIGIILPPYLIPLVLFSLLYWKSRKKLSAFADVQQAEEREASLRRSNKTFFILFATYSSGTALSTVSGLVLTGVAIMFGNSVALYVSKIVLWAFSATFLIVDPVVFLQNREYKEVLKKTFKELKMKIAAKLAGV